MTNRRMTRQKTLQSIGKRSMEVEEEIDHNLRERNILAHRFEMVFGNHRDFQEDSAIEVDELCQ
jgi:hypothetical protein